METFLWRYALPYDERYPVVCFDERLCFLIGEETGPIRMQSGRVAKQHCVYVKNGSCASPAVVYERRIQKECALFFKELAAAYPGAEKTQRPVTVFKNSFTTHVLNCPAGPFTV